MRIKSFRATRLSVTELRRHGHSAFRRRVRIGVSPGCYTYLVPTKHQRILVTKDAELADALARVESLFDETPTATIVHDLAVRGADAMLNEEERRRAAIERLIEWSTGDDFLDRDVLERIDELAWGE